MDKNEIFLEEIKKVDESKLPEIITDHIKKIELINESLKKAEDNKKAIENKVNNTLLAAKTLVTDAKELGKSEEKLHYLFGNTNWKSWTTKKDEINAIKENIEGMVKYEKANSEAQVKLVELQKEITESQSFLLEVQRLQLEYQKAISQSTKFLFNFCAWNMGQSQNVLTNLKAVIDGASKEKLGEMALKEFENACLQIKNQENLLIRVNECNDKILECDERLVEYSEELDIVKDDIAKTKDTIESVNEELTKQQQKNEEIDNALKEGEEKDTEQDAILEKHSKKNEEFDNAIKESEKRDIEQDAILEKHSKKNEEFDNAIKEGEKKDNEQDSFLSDLLQKYNEQNNQICEFQKEIKQLQDDIGLLKTEKGSKIMSFISLGIGVIAFILSILGLIVF